MTDTVDKVIIQSSSEGTDEATSELQGLAKAYDGVTVASQNTEKSTTSVESKFAALERRLGTTQGQTSKAEAAFRTINTALAQNPSLADRAAEATAAVAVKYGVVSDAEKALGTEHDALSQQSQSLFHAIRGAAEQMALGVSPTQALTAQLNHLTYAASGEGGLSGAFNGVITMAGRLVSSFVSPTTAVLALGAGALYLGNSWSESQAKMDRAVIGIGAATGATSADLAKFAKDNSSAVGLTIGEAQNAAIEFTKTGNIAVQGLKGVGDAIHGYAVLTGQDATAATKTFADALSGDLVKGAEKIDQTYGVLNSSSLEYIRTLELQGDRSKAIQVIIDAIAPSNKQAADSVGLLSKAYQVLAGAMSQVKAGPVSPATTPTDRLAAAQSQRDTAAQSGTTIGRNSNNELVQFASNADLLASLDKQIDDLQKKADAFNTAHVSTELNRMSQAGDAVVKSIIPQIDQINALEQSLATLQAAQNTPGVSRSLGQDDAAVTAIQNQIAGLKEAQGQADRYNQRVAAISMQWGDVGQSTALALQHAQNQLPVLEAVGGAAKIAAQATADYKNAIDQGKTSTEAAAIAASNQASALAQVNSNAQQALASLRDQYAVVSAQTAQQSILAQGQATYNQLLRDGVDAETAMAVATQQVQNAQEQVYQNMQKAVQASRDQVALAATQGTAEQAQVKAAIAYRQAIDAGADSTQAAIIANNTAAVATAQWAEQAQKLAEAYENAARAAHDAQFTDVTPGGDNSFSFFGIKPGQQYTSTSNAGQAIVNAYNQYVKPGGDAKSLTDMVDASLASGSGIDAALANVKSQQAGGQQVATINVPGVTTGPVAYSTFGLPDVVTKQATSESDIISSADALYSLKNSMTSDKSVQAANMNDELAWLQSRPESIARDQKIASLQQSIDQLKTSTDNLTSTNQDLLSPYYSQDPRTSHIGFRSQGMATGGEFTVPGGYSANDNMMAQVPVASGEIVSVRRPGQNLGGSTTQNVINLGGITINSSGGGNVDSNEIGRTVYQAMQMAARKLQAAQQ